MKFKLDEHLPVEAADRLRKVGFDAATVLEQALGGCPDKDLAEICKREGRALVTLDLDFANILAYPPGNYPGIIVLRLDRQDRTEVIRALERLIPILGHESLAGHQWIVDERQVRIRD